MNNIGELRKRLLVLALVPGTGTGTIALTWASIIGRRGYIPADGAPVANKVDSLKFYYSKDPALRLRCSTSVQTQAQVVRPDLLF